MSTVLDDLIVTFTDESHEVPCIVGTLEGDVPCPKVAVWQLIFDYPCMHAKTCQEHTDKHVAEANSGTVFSCGVCHLPIMRLVSVVPLC